jgi:hypothetical protein
MAVIGTKLATAAVANARACRDLCLATNKCVGWNFFSALPKANCDLMPTNKDIFAWQGTIAGTVSRGH